MPISFSPVKPMKAFTHGFTDSVDPDNVSNHPFFVDGELQMIMIMMMIIIMIIIIFKNDNDNYNDENNNNNNNNNNDDGNNDNVSNHPFFVDSELH